MANCYDNVIGIKGYCSDVTPSSGLWLNDLTGLDLISLDHGANAEQQTAITLVLSKIESAFNLMKAESQNIMSSRWHFQTSASDSVIGFFPESVSPIAAAPVFRGIAARFGQVDYFSLGLTAITFLLPETVANIPVFVVDLRTGVTVDTIACSSVANVPTRTNVAKKYITSGQMLNYAFLFDTTTIQTYNTTLYPTASCGSCKNGYYENGSILERAIKIPTASAKVEANISSDGFAGGMSVQYQLACSFDSLLCAHMPQLGYALLYKTGSLLMQELKYSKRLNGIIFTNRESFSELEVYYQQKYEEYLNTYWNRANLSSGCIICNKSIKQVVRIP